MGVGSNVAVQTFREEQLACLRAGEGCFVFNKVSIDSKFEIKASSESYNGRSGLDSHTKSSFECCFS
jgi:hypothetical protein